MNDKKDKLKKQLLKIEAKEEAMGQVLMAVCEVTGISEEVLKSKDTKRYICDARHAFFYLAMLNRDYKFSLDELGNYLNRDHATVLHSKRVTEDFMLVDKQFKRMILKISKLLPSIITPMTNEEKQTAIKLLKSRIEVLQHWLNTHPENPYRVKIQEDLRELNNELKQLESNTETI